MVCGPLKEYQGSSQGYFFRMQMGLGFRVYWGYIRVILGLQGGYIRVILMGYMSLIIYNHTVMGRFFLNSILMAQQTIEKGKAEAPRQGVLVMLTILHDLSIL